MKPSEEVQWDASVLLNAVPTGRKHGFCLFTQTPSSIQERSHHLWVNRGKCAPTLLSQVTGSLSSFSPQTLTSPSLSFRSQMSPHRGYSSFLLTHGASLP